MSNILALLNTDSTIPFNTFSYTDPESDSVSTVKNESLSLNGTLTINGSAASVGDTFTSGDTLIYNGNAASLTFSESEHGATFSPLSATLNIIEDDYAGDTSTTGTISLGGSVTGDSQLAGTDHDWFAAT